MQRPHPTRHSGAPALAAVAQPALPTPPTPDEWIGAVLRDILHLVSVPRLYWLALLLLLLVQVFAGTAWTEGEKNRARWPTLKRLLRDGFRTVVVLVSVNIGANAVPVLGWTIPVAWSGAIWLTIRDIGRSATAAETGLRKMLDEMWAEVRRRNRLVMAAGPDPVVPAVGAPGAAVPPGEEDGALGLDEPLPEPPGATQGDVGSDTPWDGTVPEAVPYTGPAPGPPGPTN